MKIATTDTLFLRIGQGVKTYNAENVYTSEESLPSYPFNQYQPLDRLPCGITGEIFNFACSEFTT